MDTENILLSKKEATFQYMLYISTLEDLERLVGVKKKVFAQAKAFSNLLNSPTILVWNSGGNVRVSHVEGSRTYELAANLFALRNKFDKLLYYKKLRKVLPFVISYDSGQRIAYLRCTLYNKSFLNLLSCLKKENYKVAIEIPTSTFLKEYSNKGVAGRYLYLSYAKYHQAIYSIADLIVAIGEISESLKGFEHKVLETSNGIDLSEVPLIGPPAFTKQLNLIGVANVSYWHGYDRLLRGLAEYYASSKGFEVNFHVVGDGPELSALRNLTEKLKLDSHVFFHGRKSGNELYEVYKKRHVGIGSLGNHRKNMFTTSELKLREYCACGLPFLHATSDSDFPEQFPFALKVQSNEEPIDVLEIIRFYERIREQYPDYPEQMRKYAEENLTWDMKLHQVIERIQESISTGGE